MHGQQYIKKRTYWFHRFRSKLSFVDGWSFRCSTLHHCQTVNLY